MGYRKHQVNLFSNKRTATIVGVNLEPDGNPLAHLFLHRLVSVNERLLVDDDFCRVRFWSADS